LHSGRTNCCTLVLAALTTVCAQAANKQSPAEVQSVRAVPSDDGAVLEIVASRPLSPTVQIVEAPLRLVIDLSATLGNKHRRLAFHNDQIKGVRVSQNQTQPPVTRIVLDLATPVRYTTESSGVHTKIHVRADQAATSKPESVLALTTGIQPIAVPYSESTSGALVEAGSRVSSGTTISAGEQTAVLRLTRGGEVRVCPGTTVSVSTSPSGGDLLLGMSTGAMETHYHLEQSSDSILTPDFRIVFPGPGEFNFAVNSDAKGNTCVSSMPGSTSSVVIAELLGNGTYEVKPGQQALFRKGSLERVDQPLASCGCPLRQEPILRASVDPPPVLPNEQIGSRLEIASDDSPAQGSSNTASGPGIDAPESKPLPDTKPGEMKVEMEAPLVFSGKELAKARAPKAPVLEAAALPLSARRDPIPTVVVLPPDPQPTHKGFFRKIKGFFGAVFR